MYRHRYSTPVRNRSYRRPVDRSKLKSWLVTMVAGAVLALGFVFVSWQHVEAMRLQYESEKLKDELRKLDAEKRRLETEKQRKLSPVQMDETARKQGLAPPTIQQTVGAEVKK